MIDLRSDTLTRPTAAMREAMLAADVGDDVYGEDPSVSALEQQAAHLLQKPAALFCASGTQSNLVALLAHCQRGDEYIVGQSAHTYRFEGGGAAVLGSIQPQPLPVQTDATLALDDIEAHIKPDDVHFARTRLVCLENTHNGQALRLPYIQQVAQLCRQHQLALHLDGARLFNACLDQDYTAATVAAPFDSISICLSKGLGAPVGSVLVGTQALIDSARRWRKMLGGGMRQAGMLAAAGSYALHQHIDRLAQDHAHAAQVKQALVERFSPTSIVHHTNMLHLKLDHPTYHRLSQHLHDAGIRVNRPRWVFHLDISDADTLLIANAIQRFPAA